VKALSIQQPWAHAILHFGKDVENRSWDTKFRGEFLIHAGKKFDLEGWTWIKLNWIALGLPENDFASYGMRPQDFQMGGIVGKATLDEVIVDVGLNREHGRLLMPWFFGPKGFVLSNAQPVPFQPMSGKLGFFEVALDTHPLACSA